MQERRSFKLKLIISLPSIIIYPDAGYNILNIQFINVDFPAPVRPTMPTLSPAEILKLAFLITRGNY